MITYGRNGVTALDGAGVTLADSGGGWTWRRHCDCLRNRAVAFLNRAGGGDRKEGKSEHWEGRDAREHLCCQPESAKKAGSAVSNLAIPSYAFIATTFAFDHLHTPHDFPNI